MNRLIGQTAQKAAVARMGETIAFSRVEPVGTGDTISTGREAEAIPVPGGQDPVMALAGRARDRKDDTKLSIALGKLVDEDPALIIEKNPDIGEMILRGQGEMHLRVAAEKLSSRFGVASIKSRKFNVTF